MFKRMLIAAVLVPVLGSSASAQQPPGFTLYLIGFMTRATGQLPAGSTLQQLEKSHLANLDAMWKEGLLLASGPIADKGDLRGVLIFSGDQRETVEKRVADDPLVKAAFLQVALGPWVGPSGIGDEYKKWVVANPGVPDKMRTYQIVLLKNVWSEPPSTWEEREAQLRQMDAMGKAGKLSVAGPVLEGSDLAWVYVFSVAAEEADNILASVPAIKAGKLIAERHPWMVAEGVLPPGFKVPLR
jgi:uncharacterized protein YciI